MPIGERFAGFLRHPPVASGQLPDDAALDAGTAHVLHSNLSTASAQNVRLLGHQIGPGPVGFDGSLLGQWSGIVDAFNPDDSDPFSAIPWVQPDQCVCLGPWPLAMVAVDAAGYTARSIRVVVECVKSSTSGTTLDVLAVVTSAPGTPLVAERLAAAQSLQLTAAHAGSYAVDLVLNLSAARPRESWRSRESSTSEGRVVVAPAWLWVGWVARNLDYLDSILSISAWEGPTP